MTEKNSTSINAALGALKSTGGKVDLEVGVYPISETVMLNSPSTKLCGEVWAYSLDPNGVFETPYGTKLRLERRDIPAISVGCDALPAGAIISDLSIQGDISGMDTRPLLVLETPYASAGLYFGGNRVDQGEFSKISCCGLAIAVSAAEDAELDACIFDRINTDGCCIGVYFAPRASYYPHFRHCVMADNPSYGFFADGTQAKARGFDIYGMDVTDCNFVRCCGSSPIKYEEPAAVYFKNIFGCSFRDNLIERAGTFWYYPDGATSNDERQTSTSPAIGLHVIGNKNVISGNIFKGSSRESIVINGDKNVLTNNVCDGDVIISGRGNIVNCLVFTTENAKLILSREAHETTEIFGVNQNRIVKL